MNRAPSLLLTLCLTACAAGVGEVDPSADAASPDAATLDVDADVVDARVIDAPPAIDAPTASAARIRRLAWAWVGCDGAADEPLGLRITVEVDSGPGTVVGLAGTVTACAPFTASPAAITCFPAVPPAGRTLVVHATPPAGLGHTASTSLVECVDGAYTPPPDDDGDGV